MSAGKDPMLRGNPAPAGFASSVSGWIQQFIAHTRLSNGGSSGMLMVARLNTIDGCSSAAVAAGDDDPRIRTLALASPGPRWAPGPNQQAAVEGAGIKAGSIAGVSGEVDDLLTGDRLLNALAHGAVFDIQAARERELSQLRKQPDLPPTASAVLDEAVAGRETAERLVRELRTSLDTVRGDYVREKASRRNLERILASTGEIEQIVGDPAKRGGVPADVRGVRQRGVNRYEALIYKGESANGKQRGLGVFPTIDEAVQVRARAVKAEKEEALARRGAAPPLKVPEMDADRGAEQVEHERHEREMGLVG